MLRSPSLLAALAAAACAWPAAAGAAIPNSSPITTRGVGPLRIGLTEKQVEKVVGRQITINRLAGVGGVCGTARLGQELVGLFTRTLLTRVYVNDSRFRTRKGGRVGMTESRLRSMYAGQLTRQPHKYVPGWYYRYTLNGRRIVFEVTKGKVISISAGRIPEVDYVEGCA